jgi:hypothetical protein
MQTSFLAIVYKITTLADGGWRISFDVPMTERANIMELSKMFKKIVQLGVVVNEKQDYSEPEDEY